MADILNWLTPRKTVLLIIILGFFVYFNSLFNGFVWDDEEQIVNNQIIQSVSNFPQIFSGATFSTGGAGLSGWFFRPLLTFTYMLNYAVWGQNSFGFHLFQVILHLLNAVLLFKILEQLTKFSKNKFKIIINTGLAGIFAIHPAIVEAVAYIASLHYVLMTFFGLFAFYLIITGFQERINLKRTLLIFILITFALFNNESAAIIFPIIFSYLIVYRRRDIKIWSLLLFATAVIYLIIRLSLAHTPVRHPEFAPISEAPLNIRLITVPLEVLSYLKLVVFPSDLAISKHFLVTRVSSIQFWGAAVVDFVLFIITVFLSWSFKSRLVFFGLVWFTLGIGLVSNIFPLDMTIAERWLYFPLIGLILIFTGALQQANFSKKTGWVFVTLLISILSILGLKTIIRNTNWYNGLTLYSHDIQISQNSFDLENNLGVELFRTGDYQNAKTHFEKSIKLQPKWHFAYNNLGAVYEKAGDLQKAADLYKKTLELSDYYLAYENLANILLRIGNPTETKTFTEEALKKLPNNSRLWLTLALTKYNLNDLEGAKAAAKNSFQILPNPQNTYVYQRLEHNLPLSASD